MGLGQFDWDSVQMANDEPILLQAMLGSSRSTYWDPGSCQAKVTTCKPTGRTHLKTSLSRKMTMGAAPAHVEL
ncbi:hypothetical protein PTI98_010561 [Pleurotus ostreatus]|nr:hypothetical protein PTI98_010561 [Pleurotus ostreatus]